MSKIEITEIRRVTQQLLLAAGLNPENADVVTDVFIRATLRGLGNHDLQDLPGRLKNLVEGKIKANPEIKMIHQFGCLENYEGDNGLGELCGMFVMKRAEALAAVHGIGCCSVRNTNHILASTPYVEVAAEDGFVGYIITRGAPTSPMGYAIPTDKGYPVMFDACIAYASNGLLHDLAKAGESVPPYWGLDAAGQPTTNPAEISKGTRLPIAGHKGFGITILGEVLTGILSEGQVIDEPQAGTGLVGMPSHTAICIDVDALIGTGQLKKRASEMVDRMSARAENLQLPGQRSYANKTKILSSECFVLEDELVNKINEWAKKMGVATITGT
jgi:LDH2 family malate/lactate/ureidoglycolate dehydrogenase